MKKRNLLAVLPLAFACALPAQERVPKLLLPVDSAVVLHVKGPAAFQKIHQNDPSGRIFGDPAIAAKWKDVVDAFRPLLEELSENIPDEVKVTPDQVTALPELIKQFDGSLTVGLWMDSQISIEEFDLQPFGLVVQLAPGAQELTALSKAVGATFDEFVDETRELEVGDLQLQVMTLPFEGLDIEITRPFLHAGQLTVVAAGDVEAMVKRCLADRERSAELVRKLAAHSVYGHLDLRNAAKALRAVEAAADEGVGLWIKSLMDVMGFGTLERLSSGTSTSGGHTITTTQMTWTGEPTGILGCLIPPRGAVSTLQGFVPTQLQVASLMHFDVSKMARCFMDIVKLTAFGMEGAGRPTPAIDEAAAAFEEKTGLRLFADLLDHLGTDWMKVDHSPVLTEEELMEEEEALDARAQRLSDKYSDSCFVGNLRDGAAFAKSFERLIRKMALHTGRKRTEYKGHRVYKMTNPLFGGLEFHYCVHPQAFLFGIGKGGRIGLLAVLDEIQDRSQGKERTLPKAITSRLSGQQGYYSFGFTNMSEVAAYMKQQFALFGEMTEEPGADPWEEMMAEDVPDARVRKALSRLITAGLALIDVIPTQGAEYSVTTTRWTGKTMTMREIW